MIKISAEFIESTGKVSSYSSDNQANTSRLSYLSVPSPGKKLFYLSESDDKITSPLDGLHLWADENVGYPGWVSHTYSDANGEFSEGNEPSLVINGTGITSLVLYSDLEEGHYLDSVEVYGMIYEGIGNRLVIALDSPVDIVVIKIKKINTPYQPVKITGVEMGLTLDFVDEDIIDYSFAGQSQSNLSGIQYGVISRFGNLELHNSNRLFNNLNDLDILQKTIPITVYINNKQFGTYLLEDGELQIDASSVTFNLTDKLINLDQIAWKAGSYLEYSKTAKEFLDFIMSYIGETYIFSNSKTEDIFNNTVLSITAVEVDDVKQVLNNICEITNSSIFIDNAGQICVRYLEITTSEVV